MRAAVISVVMVALLAVILGSWWWGRLQDALLDPVGGAKEAVIIVEPGDGAQEVTAKLATNGLIADQAAVSWYAEKMAQDWALTPGEYLVSAQRSAVGLMRKISNGKVIKHEVNVPPGSTVMEAFGVLEKAGLATTEALLRAAQSDSFLRQADLKRAGAGGLAVEGRIPAEPHSFARGHGAENLLLALVRRHRDVVKSLPKDAREVSDEDRLIVASLIEKSNVPAVERTVYAALLFNRLAKKLPLKVDATTNYATKMAPDQLALWDTQKRKGLPPTAVCNPGFSALRAAFKPAESDALYMVARSNGTHVYCPDKACYRRAKRQWKDGLPPVVTPLPPPAFEPPPDFVDPAPFGPPPDEGTDEGALEPLDDATDQPDPVTDEPDEATFDVPAPEVTTPEDTEPEPTDPEPDNDDPEPDAEEDDEAL